MISVSGFTLGPDPIPTRTERIASSEISIYKGCVDNDDTAPALIHRERIVFVEVSSTYNPGSQGCEEPRGDGIQVDIAIGSESFRALDR
jgi:hypothetical protein